MFQILHFYNAEQVYQESVFLDMYIPMRFKDVSFKTGCIEMF